MKKALITGIRGFAGSWLAAELLQNEYQVWGIDRKADPIHKPYIERELSNPIELQQIEIHASNMDDTIQLEEILYQIKEGTIFHLAGTAFVPDSWKSPLDSLQNNTACTLRLIEAAQNVDWQGSFVFVSSSDVYGAPPASQMPITEKSPLQPESPYALSKLAAEQFLPYYQSEAMRVMIARPFNHSGPGQRNSFVIPAFVERIKDALIDRKSSITVGDLDAIRDFTDVRDVVRAYRLIAEKGQTSQVYNICSGVKTSIGELMQLIQDQAQTSLELRPDPELLRPEGSSMRYGNPQKLQKLGWQTRYKLRDTIGAIWEEN